MTPQSATAVGFGQAPHLGAGGSFEPAGFAAPLGKKDIRLTLAAAEELRVPLPLANLIHDRFLTLLAHGGDRLDWSAIGQLPAEDAEFTAARDARPRRRVRRNLRRFTRVYRSATWIRR